MPSIVKKERLADLYQAILSLKTEEECQRFFEDLCTVNELSAMEQRYTVAELLLDNRVYQDIENRTSASTSTISRVKRMLSEGDTMLAEAIGRVSQSKQPPDPEEQK